MKKIFYALLLLTSSASLSAQPGIGCFSIGGFEYDYGRAMAVTYDGNYVIAGISASFGVSQDCYLIKVDPAGTLLWSHNFGNVFTETLYGMIETSDHSIVATGVSNDLILVVKYNEAGVEQWTKTIAVNGDEEGYGLVETSDGGYLIVGSTQQVQDPFYQQLYVIKLTEDGSKVWEKTFRNQDNVFGGATIGLSVNKTIDEHYIIGGWCPSLDDFYYALCLDENGNKLWTKQSTNQGVSYGFAATADSGFVLAGYSYFTSSDAQLAKFDKAGNVEWSKCYGDALWDAFNSIQAATDGGFIVAGEVKNFDFPPDNIQLGYIVKTDDEGNVEWSRVLGDPPLTNELFTDVKQTSDGAYVAAGSIGTNGADMYVAKFDANGNICPDCHSASYGQVSSGTTFTDIFMVEDPNTATIADVTLAETGGGIVSAICLSTGIENLDEQLILSIYPNPSSSGIFYLELPAEMEMAQLAVYDVFGRKIQLSQAAPGMNIIDLHAMKGTFFLQMEDGQQSYELLLLSE